MPGLFVVLVEIMQICTAMEQPAALEPILRNVDERYLSLCPNSIRVKTQYFWARHRLFQSRLPDAEHRLDDALKYCPDGHIHAKQRILNLLIPCKVRKGILPSKELLERNQLTARWAPLLRAIRQGNLAEYERCRTEALSLDDDAGTGRQILPFFLDGMLVWCVYRNLLERTMTIYGSNQVPVSVLTAALRVSEDDEDGHVCDTYAEGIVARLLLYGYCKGYISYELRTLVLATRNAFPKPPWEQLREL
ncbi:COP9 signalosome complex subunit, putative [Perkinsus marinus ATCC 50983]|nr:COP9 signalosome complex subunit, putative [Perkinsus marinus ATCC 50983]EER00750.1 COP9 signalosome complex subunit, putative [Perkinsus marinus ATCC 50983]|eukprot:XP_002768032.1 COP9 signalosome complex subunit, putative [Perkinsus marinus ATCC 50983]